MNFTFPTRHEATNESICSKPHKIQPSEYPRKSDPVSVNLSFEVQSSCSSTPIQDSAYKSVRQLVARGERAWFRYIPISPEWKSSGAYVPAAGFAATPPKAPYPPCGHRHPSSHDFMWEFGRTLPTYQFVYITRGAGVFESKSSGIQSVHAGDLIVLFPQVWHRYRPLADSGWDEYWLEFNGDYLHRLMAREEFAPKSPLLHIGVRDDLLGLFLKAIDLLRNEPPEYRVLLGTLAAQAVGCVISSLKQKSYEGRSVADVVQEAKQYLACEPSRQKNLDHLAARLNMSYSSFRRLFKTETGLSPGQFALQAKLSKAAHLLSQTNLPVHRIARQCGMESVHYFSRLFKQKTGSTPTSFRYSPLPSLDQKTATVS